MRRTVFFMVGLLLLSGCSSHYSDGFRTGIIRKFSNKGVFIKSWEGELLLNAGMTDDGHGQQMVVNETWTFSIDPDKDHGEDIEKIVKELTSAAESGKRTKVYYIQNTFPKIRTNTDYFVQKAEIIQ